MQRLKSLFILFLSGWLIVVCNISHALTLEELQNNDKLRIKVWIEPEENIIARQQVNLQIEVATDKWFTGGTKIGHFEVRNAIVLQREKFAVNSTRVLNQKSWTLQQWALVVYPQSEGLYEVPAIPLQLSIADENLDSIVGEIHTQPFTFNAKIPEQISDKSEWISTTRFEVEESFNKMSDELAPGDALIRTIKISADNLSAMMLPKVKLDDIQGISIYAKPPQLTDKANRGDYLAERTETITYVFEKTGEYQLMKQSFYWWNLESQSYEIVELDERNIKVSRFAGKVDSDESLSQLRDENGLIEFIPLLKKSGLFLVLLLSIWLVAFKLYKFYTRNRNIKPVTLSQAEIRKQFDKACRQNNMELAIGLFYQWLDHYGGNAFNGSIHESLIKLNQEELSSTFESIMKSIYAHEKSNSIDLKLFARKFVNELKKNDSQTISGILSVDLKLN